MGVTKTVLQEGTGDVVSKNDTIAMHYTGWVKDTSKPENKANQFDSSRNRGEFVVQIGVGQLIKGWDEGVPGMKVGEKALLDITSDFAYGASAIQQVGIKAHSDLIFEVELMKIVKKA